MSNLRPDNLDIRGNIISMRKQRGMSVSEMSSLMQVSEDAYNSIEQGDVTLTYNHLCNIASCFGVNVIDIITFPEKYAPMLKRDTPSGCYWESFPHVVRLMELYLPAMLIRDKTNKNKCYYVCNQNRKRLIDEPLPISKRDLNQISEDGAVSDKQLCGDVPIYIWRGIGHLILEGAKSYIGKLEYLYSNNINLFAHLTKCKDREELTSYSE